VKHDVRGSVTVYPKIVPLQVSLPSQSPSGTLPTCDRLFEDPARVQGVRDYQPGDSLRRMDWKTSGRLGRLQVRRYEPAIALETMFLLNLAGADYPGVERYQATEMGIVIAASLAVHIGWLRQSVGLTTNGRDPFQVRPDPEANLPAEQPGRLAIPGVAPRKGGEQVMHLLDLLARIEVVPGGDAVPFLEVLVGASSQCILPWGSSAVVITGREVDGLMEALLVLRRRGLEVVLVLTCPDRDMAVTAARAEQIGAQAVCIRSVSELEAWR
jgi:uncharacterized protein (DUF58 family)